ncbi:hypothetical protein LWI29_011439 [Acer saccharum]|uniref:Uncharacterized protein n=1 Tax=Acer saccharum TaxID=4024 RepID=A0AA39VRJ4_ACESA|nr:hypothetical protein LWI29_011439 [Acer saccharum]
MVVGGFSRRRGFVLPASGELKVFMRFLPTRRGQINQPPDLEVRERYLLLPFILQGRELLWASIRPLPREKLILSRRYLQALTGRPLILLTCYNSCLLAKAMSGKDIGMILELPTVLRFRGKASETELFLRNGQLEASIAMAELWSVKLESRVTSTEQEATKSVEDAKTAKETLAATQCTILESQQKVKDARLHYEKLIEDLS